MTEDSKEKIVNEEMKKLFIDFKNGDNSARNKLIELNLRLVTYRVFDKFRMFDYDKEELFSVGVIGLIKAVDSFDISKGREFSTYASRCVDNEILMFLRKVKRYSEVIGFDDFSFDAANDDNLSLLDMIKSDLNIEEDFVENDMRKNNLPIIRSLLDSLSERDREIIKLRFGFYGKQYKQCEIALKFGISRSYVSRIIEKVIKKLRTRLEVNSGYVTFNLHSEGSNDFVDEVEDVIEVSDSDNKINVVEILQLFNMSVFREIMGDVISDEEIEMLVKILEMFVENNINLDKVEVKSMLLKMLIIYKERVNSFIDDASKILSEKEFDNILCKKKL